MNATSQNLLAAALGQMNFDSADAARNMNRQSVFPTDGFVPDVVAARWAESIWAAGLLAIAGTAAAALGGDATASSVLTAWQASGPEAGGAFQYVGFGDVTATVSGVAILGALNP